MSLKIELSSDKSVKSRTVYNFITLISEVSGFADLVLVASTFFITRIFSPSGFESAIAKNVGVFSFASKKRMQVKNVWDLNATLDKSNLLDVLKQMQLRKVIDLPVLYLMVTPFICKSCRSGRTKKLLKYKEKSIARFEKAVDIK